MGRLIAKFRTLKRRAGKLWELSRKALDALRREGFRAMLGKVAAYWEKRKNAKLCNDSLERSNCFGCFREDVPEPADIPQSWIDIQPVKPLISIIMAVRCTQLRGYALCRALESVAGQKYKNLELLLVCPDREEQQVNALILPFGEQIRIRLITVEDSAIQKEFWDAALKEASGELIALMEQEDILTPNALAYVLEAANERPQTEIFVIPDDRFFDEGDYFHPDYKIGVDREVGGVEALLHMGVFRNHGYLFTNGEMEAYLRSLDKELIQVMNWVGCHGEAVESLWKDAASVRCLAFYLPQFHAIPENDEWWGKGFTEWVNVKKAAPLYPGHHQPRIPTELGYYDLGDEQTGTEVQKKQMALAREYGLSGFCYYYYWFDGGKRLLEKPLDRHVKDESMDFPFCLCWANENWSRRWDGLDREVLMPQTYKDGWEEQFITDMLPYLKDERYIRVNGAPYIMIYNIAEIPNAGAAINTWRRIAAEHGIERLHISAVRRTLEANELKHSGYTLDSLTDFPPHLLGMVDVAHSEPESFGLTSDQVKDYSKAINFHVNMGKRNYTYFRTAMLEWDNTARKGKKAYIFENFSYKDYKKWLYAGKRYAQRQNREGEDLVFINAWNEWAEGTYLEPSEHNGRSALEATREVLKMR